MWSVERGITILYLTEEAPCKSASSCRRRRRRRGESNDPVLEPALARAKRQKPRRPPPTLGHWTGLCVQRIIRSLVLPQSSSSFRSLFLFIFFAFFVPPLYPYTPLLDNYTQSKLNRTPVGQWSIQKFASSASPVSYTHKIIQWRFFSTLHTKYIYIHE